MTTDQQQEQHGKPFTSITPPLSPGIIQYLTDVGFITCMTPVQSTVLPLFLTHKDVCVRAATGSGKTLAYLIPLVEMMLRNTRLSTNQRDIGGIVVCPTRELASQVHEVCHELCRACVCPSPLLTVGNVRSAAADLKQWREVLHSDIVIGTPGRIEDLLTRYSEFQLGSNFECLILDEADLLLSMGFQGSIEAIVRALPKWKRVGLFSATMDASVKKLVSRTGMRNPVVINVDMRMNNTSSGNDNDNDPVLGQGQGQGNDSNDSSNTNTNNSTNRKSPQHQSLLSSSSSATPSSLTNYYTIVNLPQKLDRLVDFLVTHGKEERIVVFFMACACVEFYGLALQKLKEMKGDGNGTVIDIQTIHGKMHQKRRSLSLDKFINSKTGGVLLCTDVVSRGIDFNVNWVVQFDPPTDPSTYVHRVGRAGRANRIGSSLVFLSEKEDAYIEFLKLKKVPLLELPAKLAGVTPRENETGESSIVRQIKDATFKSRDLLEKGTRAYTSYVRAYKEHQCSFIFREKSLDLGHLATSFCLLKLPKMPELAQIHTKMNFTPEPDVVFYKIPYEDRVREKARQARINDEERKEKITKRREEKKHKREDKKAKHEERLKQHINRKRVGRHQQILEEWDDLAKEERLYKKLKRGKISQIEHDRLMYGEHFKEKDVPKIANSDLDDLDDIE